MHQLLAAKPVVERIYTELKDDVIEFRKKTGRAPKLVVVLVGDDPASLIYTTKKSKEAHLLGMDSENVRFSANSEPTEVFAKIDELNADPKVDGILIQRPLPSQFDSSDVLTWVTPEKDVDCFHPTNVGLLTLGRPGLRSCTPYGILKLLHHYQIPIAGHVVCVIGRSAIVGKPMAALLLNESATVIQAHSKTKNLASMTGQAEILIVAAGRAKMIRAEHVRKNAVVIDVGIHRQEDGKLCGDVDFESVSRVASAITPVPGGIGPMTIATLLSNTLHAAQMRETKRIKQ